MHIAQCDGSNCVASKVGQTCFFIKLWHKNASRKKQRGVFTFIMLLRDRERRSTEQSVISQLPNMLQQSGGASGHVIWGHRTWQGRFCSWLNDFMSNMWHTTILAHGKSWQPKAKSQDNLRALRQGHKRPCAGHFNTSHI